MDPTLMAKFQFFSLRGSEKLSIKMVEQDFKEGTHEYSLCCVGRFMWGKPINIKAYRTCGNWDHTVLSYPSLPPNTSREEKDKQEYGFWLVVDTKFHEESELLVNVNLDEAGQIISIDNIRADCLEKPIPGCRL
ncbi:hypothetical protein M9H77_27037 [Catharanthus roseus]|uniref:Uncharacterized protein n=1 Tax=Catharanthus roseus TaxID=4058 RepID=A0ACC0ADJ3_CATRO|nr:hypothetical protein M9H77_27037 [Catharanthus roseus]